MRGLVLVVATDDPERFHAALSLAAAAAATGARARLFLHEGAVLLLGCNKASGDERRRAAGLPDLAILRDEALALGVTIVACQSGLALGGMDAAGLDPRIETGGLVGLMAGLGEDRLLFV